ncbi:MAG: hypothetical protein Q9162_001708 [Coniocarpon cinnabarinum]
MAEEPRKRRKIVPEPGKRNILITSALPYVNNVPHLGNVVGSVLSADVFARYCKARGLNALFVCGTDEYGTATETKALEEKCTPQELCDKYYTLHAQVYEWFNIDFDIFGRTPTKQQTEITQDIFLKLYKNGFMQERTTTQPYCEKHKSYLADRFVEGECPLCGYNDARGDQCDKCGKLLDPLDLKNPRCKLDGATPVPRETKHVFLELDKLQPEIEKWFHDACAKGEWSSNGRDITGSWLKEGLKPRGITRDLKWGTAVPLPGYEDKVIYVWFDACIGYVSITANYTDEWEKWWRDPDNVQLYQFMGKDNVPFHTVVFPGSQIGTRDTWTKLHHLSTTEYLNYENGKFSKSRGIGVFGDSAKKTGIASDVWRYYLLSHRPETGDTEFVWKSFIDANNNVLLKNLGNFVNRVIKFVNAKFEGSHLPDYTAYTEPAFDSWKEEVNSLLKRYVEELEAVKLRAGLVTVLHISDQGNLLLQSHTLDNRLLDTQPEKCAAVLGLAVNLCHLLASVVEPYMPDTAASMNKQLNTEPLIIPDTWSADSIKPNHALGKADYLFKQIKPEKETEWREMFGGEEAKKAKEEEAKKKAAKKADKLAKKEKKKGEAGGQPSVESVEKGGAQKLSEPPKENGVDEVTEGVHQAALQTS